MADSMNLKPGIYSGEEEARILQAAQVNATLALVEQHRVANIIALAESQYVSGLVHKYPEIAEALQLWSARVPVDTDTGQATPRAPDDVTQAVLKVVNRPAPNDGGTWLQGWQGAMREVRRTVYLELGWQLP